MAFEAPVTENSKSVPTRRGLLSVAALNAPTSVSNARIPINLTPVYRQNHTENEGEFNGLKKLNALNEANGDRIQNSESGIRNPEFRQARSEKA